MITLLEHSTKEYPARTRVNIRETDATLAIAVDFASAGERLTHKLATEQKKLYIRVAASARTVTEAASQIVEQLNTLPAPVIRLNIAGNGIYRFEGVSQLQVDYYVFTLLRLVVESPRLKKTIIGVRTGGQTGVDEAGAKAAARLRIPVTVLFPKGRNLRGYYPGPIPPLHRRAAGWHGPRAQKTERP
jgi:hypothetical protein